MAQTFTATPSSKYKLTRKRHSKAVSANVYTPNLSGTHAAYCVCVCVVWRPMECSVSSALPCFVCNCIPLLIETRSSSKRKHIQSATDSVCVCVCVCVCVRVCVRACVYTVHNINIHNISNNNYNNMNKLPNFDFRVKYSSWTLSWPPLF